jgi:CelD/BcsL family acetyltransferase involved in cellulose biosynthesis
MSVIECVNTLPRDSSFAAARKLAVPASVEAIDPLQDSRWERLVERHPRASLFHSTAWLRALAKTYGYKPVAYALTSSAPRLDGGVAFCQIESWLTGKRLVSLPFSDHCEPLVDSQLDSDSLTAALAKQSQEEKWRYIEMRPLHSRFEVFPSLQATAVPYTLHLLDLRPDLETLFHNCHKNSTQRKILRAGREGLECREGGGEYLDAFYRLHAITRKRHRRPPQPREWFVNLIEGFGDQLKIRVALHNDCPVAAVMTIRHKDTLVYKYGGSDPRFNHLGSMHLLLWGAISEAKAARLRCFDFGRTEAGQDGLITFKKRWGTTQTELVYSRYSVSENVSHMFEVTPADWKSRAAKYLLAHMQPGILSVVGRALYRHVG